MAYSPAEFVHAGIRLVGVSLAGEETSIVAPELNLAFDIGRAPADTLTVDHVFLSHGHMDHAAGVAYYFSQRMFIDNRPGTVYAPAPLVEPIQRLLRVWADIDGHEPDANLAAARPGEDIAIRRDLIVRPFEVNHPCKRREKGTVTALGYAVLEVRQKLFEEYLGLTGHQIVELKKQGVQITQRVEIPLLAYCGDTADGPFFELEHVKNAKILLLECTFVEPDHKSRARAGFHLHVHDLRDIFRRLNNERILLTHLSRRTALGDARAILRREIGDAEMERVSFFMDHRARRRRAGAAGSAVPRPDASDSPSEDASA